MYAMNRDIRTNINEIAIIDESYVLLINVVVVKFDVKEHEFELTSDSISQRFFI